jgi:hypothetical protein
VGSPVRAAYIPLPFLREHPLFEWETRARRGWSARWKLPRTWLPLLAFVLSMATLWFEPLAVRIHPFLQLLPMATIWLLLDMQAVLHTHQRLLAMQESGLLRDLYLAGTRSHHTIGAFLYAHRRSWILAAMLPAFALCLLANDGLVILATLGFLVILAKVLAAHQTRSMSPTTPGGRYVLDQEQIRYFLFALRPAQIVIMRLGPGMLIIAAIALLQFSGRQLSMLLLANLILGAAGALRIALGIRFYGRYLRRFQAPILFGLLEDYCRGEDLDHARVRELAGWEWGKGRNPDFPGA